MRRWGSFSARRHAGAGSGGNGNQSGRTRWAGLLGAGVPQLLLVMVVVAQACAPFAALRGKSSPTVTPVRLASATATTAPSLPIPAADPQLTWPTYMGQPARTGTAGTESELTATTVDQLKVRWRFHAGAPIFAQPVVANGIVYWGSWDGYEHANSLATGKEVWASYLGKTTVISCEGETVGVSSTATVAFASVQGRRTLLVFVGGGDGNFYALNAATGKVVWKTSLGTPPATYLWSSPAYAANSIYMGVASLGDCPLVQGRVVKLSAASGKIESAFAMTPNGCVGGTVWGSVTIAQELGILYAATGNPGDCGARQPYSDALVALRTSDLSFVGAWQDAGALEFVDSDFGSTPTLFTAQVNGAARQMVGLVNKDGNFYAFDAANVSRGPVWTTRIANVAICPYCGDGGFVPGAWDGKLLYEPGGKTTLNGKLCPGGLRALNPANGAVVWSACYPGPTFGALTLGPGFLVIGAGPRLLVVSTETGKTGRILYTFQDAQAPNPRFFGAPSLADGQLLVGDERGNLYVLGL